VEYKGYVVNLVGSFYEISPILDILLNLRYDLKFGRPMGQRVNDVL